MFSVLWMAQRWGIERKEQWGHRADGFLSLSCSAQSDMLSFAISNIQIALKASDAGSHVNICLYDAEVEWRLSVAPFHWDLTLPLFFYHNTTLFIPTVLLETITICLQSASLVAFFSFSTCLSG